MSFFACCDLHTSIQTTHQASFSTWCQLQVCVDLSTSRISIGSQERNLKIKSNVHMRLYPDVCNASQSHVEKSFLSLSSDMTLGRKTRLCNESRSFWSFNTFMLRPVKQCVGLGRHWVGRSRSSCPVTVLNTGMNQTSLAFFMRQFLSDTKERGEQVQPSVTRSRVHGGYSTEELWRQFFADPSQWWDHTIEKVEPNYPDFKHQKTGVGLWIEQITNPSWVKGKLASMLSGSVPRSLFSWNCMLSKCANSKQGHEALKLFWQIQAAGLMPDSFTFVRVLNACASLPALEEGRLVHAQVIQSGWESDVFVGSSLINMYAKCGNMDDAWRVFNTMSTRDVISWNVVLAGCVICEQEQKTIKLFEQMQAEGVQPSPVTFVAVINACASLSLIEEGRHVHAQVIQTKCESNVYVGSSLVDMYSKCGSIGDAWRVFHTMASPNVVSWNAILAGYKKCEQGQKALQLFAHMVADGVKPDPVTFVTVLNACASVMALEEGRRVHGQVIESGCEADVFVGSTLVDMYAKCGSIEDAWRVFHRMPMRNVVSWNAMLGALAMHGHGEEAILLFQDMYSTGVEMDTVTFVCLLSACSQGGLVEDGVRFFESMDSDYGISPTVEHYICMVDLLGRAGRLEEAEDLLKSGPKVSKDSTALMALLGACRSHNNVEMGERIAQQLLELYPDDAPGYVLS